MQVRGRWGIAVAAMLGLSLLASCGGGGGGGDSGGGLQVSVDKSSLRLVGFAYALIPEESIHFTMRGGSGTYYAGVSADQPGLLQATFTPTSDTTATVSISPIGTAGVVTSGNITFLLCRDPFCAQVAWSQTIPYTLSMFQLTQANVTVNGHEGALSTTTLDITPPDTQNVLRVSVPGTGTPWLTASRSSATQITVNTSGAGLVRGNYQGSVSVGFAAPVPTNVHQDIPVSFTVGDGIALPPARTLELTRGTSAASLAGTADITFPGTQSPAWTAISDQAWLVLGNANGTGPGTLSYSIDTTHLDGIANWSTGVANVQVSAAGLSSASFQISLAKRLPEVLTATPNPMVAGRSTTLRVAGRGFSQLSNANQISVGNTAGVTGTVLSDTDALLTVPPMAAGSTTISIANTAGVATTQAQTAVVTPVTLPAAFVPRTGEKRSAVFDPVRNALYVVNLTANSLQRHRYSGGQWLTDSLAVPEIGDIAFSPDRSTLYLGSGARTLLAIDPDTLQVRSNHLHPNTDPASHPLQPDWYATRGMAVTNNLRLWFGGSQWAWVSYFDLRTQAFTSLTTMDSTFGGTLYSPQFFASGDGSKMIAAQFGISPTPAPQLYSAGPDSARALSASLSINTYAVLNEDGSKALINRQTLYSTADSTMLGTLPLAGFAMNSALSANGSVAYVLAGTMDNNFNITANRVEVYDTTQLVGGDSTAFRSLGQISLPGAAVDCGANPPLGCSRVGNFVISPLNDTLFWIGGQGVAVIPIPNGMVQAASSNRSLLRPAAR